jgi:hypothetical protein
MLKKISMLSAIAAVLALTVALPASANGIPTTGTQINIRFPPATYPANTPFYVEHGFGCLLDSDSASCANASTAFVLWVDGVQQPSQKDVSVVYNTFIGAKLLGVSYLTNFPDGLPLGTHTFTGIWYQNGSISDEATATVSFTP